MKQYLSLMQDILDNGHDHPDRTGTGRRSIFGTQTRFKMSDGFPLVTTRRIFARGLIEELLWFIKGDMDVKLLQDKDVHIWDPWAVKEEHFETFVDKLIAEGDVPAEARKGIIDTHMSDAVGSIGPMYGAMWRDAPRSYESNPNLPKISFKDLPSDKLAVFMKEAEEVVPETSSEETRQHMKEKYCVDRYYDSVDQLNDLVLGLKKNPFSARHIVTAWIPEFVPTDGLSPQDNVLHARGALAACHAFFQCFVHPAKEDGGKLRLSLQMFQRSVDTPVGSCLNIAQYSLLLHMLAQVTDMEPFEFIWSTGDTHIYLDQLELVKEQLTREPKPLPILWLNPEVKDLFAFTSADIRIENYDYHPAIKYPVSV